MSDSKKKNLNSDLQSENIQNFSVKGMSCAACVSRVEKTVSCVSGVSSVNVNLLTNSMAVTGKFDVKEMISLVEKEGYQVEALKENFSLDNKDFKILRKRFFSSLLFLFVLMYFSMGSMWNFPMPSFLKDNFFLNGLIQFVLSLVVLIINRKFFTKGFRSLFKFHPNMDSLVALGSGISFVYSFVILFFSKEIDKHLYFEGAAMIVTLITFGKLLESFSKGKTTNAIKSLMDLSPKSARLLINGEEEIVPVQNVKIDDLFLVKPGENIPVDGIVLEGNSYVNESALTGESMPVAKMEGSFVSSATTNIDGFLKCRATRVGKDTTLSQIIKLVSETAGTKAPIANLADKVSSYFVPSVILISLICFLIWIFLEKNFTFALNKAVSVLLISCPCALGLATPVAIMVSNGLGAKNGILFKSSKALENAGKIKIIAFDKTGTITKGNIILTDLVPFSDLSQDDFLQLAYSLELKSEHPLAKAVVKEAVKRDLNSLDFVDFKSVAGKGVHASYNGKKYFAGNLNFISQENFFDDDLKSKINSYFEKYSNQGKTCLFFAEKENNISKFLGIIAVSDEIKEDSKKAIQELNKMGLCTIMITGDNQIVAKNIAEEIGIKKYFAEVLPQEKDLIVSKLQDFGMVAMVGDGINDAPALTRSDIGIAIGAGSDIAIDAAQIVLIKNSLQDVCSAIKLSKKTLINIKENLFWAFFYNVIGIPLAAGLYYYLWGLSLSPVFSAAAMSLSSFCVVMNALRINFFNLKKERYKKSLDIDFEKIMKINLKENHKMIVKTFKVEGMMCSHCEAHVKEALELLEGVKSAAPDHVKGAVSIDLESELSDEVLIQAIEKAGYKVIL